MTSRRSFFRRIAATVAIVAMAPEIAFGQLPKSPTELEPVPYELGDVGPFWIQTSRVSAMHDEDYRKYVQLLSAQSKKIVKLAGDLKSISYE